MSPAPVVDFFISELRNMPETRSEWALNVRPRKWQEEALTEWQTQWRGIVSIVTGGGKTIFAQMCMLAFKREHPNAQFILIVPTITLLDQWFISLVEDLGVQPRDIACFSGQEKADKPKLINICVINTARKLVNAMSERFPALLIVDECHRAGSPVNAKALEGTFTATLGLSATPIREYDDGYNDYLEPALGKTIYLYDYRQAFQDKVICPFDLVNVHIPLLPDEKAEYDKLTLSLVRLQKRIEAGELLADRLKIVLQKRASVSMTAIMRIPVAAKIVDDHPGVRAIIFHERVDAASKLCENLQARGHRVTIYHSGISPVVRRSNLQLYRRGLFDVLVSCRALDEGMNVPETVIAIIASSSASTRQRIQRLGRVLRPANNKKAAKIFTLFATPAEEKRLKREESELEGVSNVLWIKADSKTNG